MGIFDEIMDSAKFRTGEMIVEWENFRVHKNLTTDNPRIIGCFFCCFFSIIRVQNDRMEVAVWTYWKV